MNPGPTRVAIHRGESASWDDGAYVLHFHAGLGVQPMEVYVPRETAWRAVAPAWARERYADAVRDFEAAGLRVVVTDRATLWD